MTNRPAAVALILLLVAIISHASAVKVIDEVITDYTDTSNSYIYPGKLGQTTRVTINSFYIEESALCNGLGYVVFEWQKGDHDARATGMWLNGTAIQEGRYDIEYSIDGLSYPGVLYYATPTDLLGQIKSYRYTLFLNDWNGTYSGPKTVELPFSMGRNTISNGVHETNETHNIRPQFSLRGPAVAVSYASWIEWKNHIVIEKNLYEYVVELFRTIEGIPYKSSIQIAKNGEIVYMSTKTGEYSTYAYPHDQIDEITVTNPNGRSFVYPLGDAGGADPADPSRVMVHIIAQDARNENLLLGAAVEVRDQYDAVVATGTTSPNGWLAFEYDLPATLADEDFQRYYTVNITLPGWTQKVTNYKFYPAFIPRSGDWIRVEMLPDTDGPADPEKTYIMFFVRDIHSNPLERASIEIAGNFWHTNSAGHVAVEVPKNSTTAYTVRKTGHVSISGSAAVGAEGSYVVNIALGPALPDRTPGPGDDPGATPPPRDTRTNEEKGKAVIDLLADNAELIATLAILAAVMGLINLIMPGRRRR